MRHKIVWSIQIALSAYLLYRTAIHSLDGDFLQAGLSALAIVVAAFLFSMLRRLEDIQ